MWHIVPQNFPYAANELEEPTQAEICAEPIFRRATPDFVRTHGGDIAQQFLLKLEQQGLVEDRTRLMCQRSPFVENAFPSSPNWHVDFMPGTKNVFASHISNPIRGSIACLCSKDRIATTSFLDKGSIMLDEPDEPAHYKPGQYLALAEGETNWMSEQVNANLYNGTIKSALLTPNRIYKYDSRNLHVAPQFKESGGYRMIFRANTPPENFSEAIPAHDKILDIDDFYFTLEDGGTSWKKHILSAS